ncbi:MAG: signal peptidase I [Deltaproteobacteria bacterium]|nr:signal peptidase I [Deltaproteobacteria bacterium]
MEEKKGQEQKDKKKNIREIVEAIVIALVLALIIRTFVIQAFKIPSGSMEETLLVGDHIVVSKFAYGIQVPKPAIIKIFGASVPFFETKLIPSWGKVDHGDVIVFRFPGDRSKDYIKRVIGLPGDRVELKEKVLYLNDKKMDDPWGVNKGGLYGEDTEKNINFGPYTVPDGTVFVMGDNRDRSYDSRYWGPVPFKDIKGKAFIIYWSWNRDSHWVRFGRLGDIIH